MNKLQKKMVTDKLIMQILASTTRLYRLQTSSRPKLGLSESKDDSYESDEKADSVETFASGGLAHTHFQVRKNQRNRIVHKLQFA